MKKNHLTKLLLAALLAAGALAYASTAPAQEGKAADPLQQKSQPAWMEYKNPYVSQHADISNPHRTTEEILVWSQKIVSSALNFEPDDFNARVTDLKKIFVGEGWNEYAGYLRESRLADMVRVDRLHVATIVNGDPMVVNKGPAGGNYHWVVSAPLLVTFMRQDLNTGEKSPVSGGNYRLTMQIGRTTPDAGDEGTVVESWRIEPDEEG